MSLSVQSSSIKSFHIVAYQISGTFSSCQTETLCPLLDSAPCPFPQRLPPPPLCLYGFDHPSTLCKWNHTLFVLLGLAYFTQHDAAKMLQHVTGFPYFFRRPNIPLLACITFLKSTYLSVDCLVIVNNAAGNMDKQYHPLKQGRLHVCTCA